MAPEVIKQTGHGRYADIWSLGCTVLEMAQGFPPWSEYNNPYTALLHIAQTEHPPSFPDFLSADAKSFLTLCFRRNPRDRPNVRKLLSHPFIVGDGGPGQDAYFGLSINSVSENFKDFAMQLEMDRSRRSHLNEEDKKEGFRKSAFKSTFGKTRGRIVNVNAQETDFSRQSSTLSRQFSRLSSQQQTFINREPSGV